MPNKQGTTPAPASANRFERRRAHTRQALIAAARQILAETGETSASIQEIADRADVGFGSFYNHFDSKNDLFYAAVSDALEEYGQLLDLVTAEVDDPAAVVSASIRLSLRLAASHPEITQIVRLRGLAYIHAAEGLGPRALRDLEVGKASGRFAFADPLVALSAVGGSVVGLLQLHTVREVDAEAGEEMAELILRMLGVPAGEAREIARRTLPELP